VAAYTQQDRSGQLRCKWCPRTFPSVPCLATHLRERHLEHVVKELADVSRFSPFLLVLAHPSLVAPTATTSRPAATEEARGKEERCSEEGLERMGGGGPRAAEADSAGQARGPSREDNAEREEDRLRSSVGFSRDYPLACC
jgi:hypothetical protein